MKYQATKFLTALTMVLYFLAPMLAFWIFPNIPSQYITGTHENISQLAFIAVMTIAAMKNKAYRLELNILALAFSFALIADFLYMLFIDAPNRDRLPIWHLMDAIYLMFYLGISWFIYKRRYRPCFDLPTAFTSLIAGLTFFYLSAEYVIIPYFRKPDFDLWYAISNCILLSWESLMVAMSFPLLLRLNNVWDLGFLGALVLICLSDLALRHDPTLHNIVIHNFYEQTWCQGMLIFFYMGLIRKGNLLSGKIDALPFTSIRVISSLATLISLAALSICLDLSGIVTASTAFAISDILFLVMVIWMLSNITAAVFSERILEIDPALIHELSPLRHPDDDSEHMTQFRMLTSYSHIHETSTLIARYNWLSEKANLLLAETAKQSRMAAIGKTTQMLAHDVRRPFSMFRIALRLLEDQRDPEKLRKIIHKIVPEVNRAASSVEGMIRDIMEVGSSAKPVMTPFPLDALLRSTLNDIITLRHNASISVIWDLKHTHHARGDSLKIARVFSNIFDNAVQAMGQHGQLNIRTQMLNEKTTPFIQVDIANSGPRIQDSDVSQLFNAFFSSGKKGGTGLGLAIAYKVISDHGGKIWCTNGDLTGVEFSFTLPASDPISSYDQLDPAAPSLEGIHSSLHKISGIDSLTQLIDTREWSASRKAEFLSHFKQDDTPLIVHIVDDEIIYLDGLSYLLEKDQDVHSKIRIKKSRSGEEALGKVREEAPHLMICDVDLGNPHFNGLDLIHQVKKFAPDAYICVHSNRSLELDARAAMDAGADTVLPKPMSTSHLFELLLYTSRGMRNRFAES